MYRNPSFEERLYQELQDLEFAREYLLALMEGEEALDLETALKTLIQKMGIKEFCDLTEVQMPNIVDFIKGRRHPKPETLDLYLKPFRLRTKLIAVQAS